MILRRNIISFFCLILIINLVSCKEKSKNEFCIQKEDIINNIHKDYNIGNIEKITNEDLVCEKPQENLQKDEEETRESVPEIKKTIVIDPGHGGGANLEKEKQSPDSNILKIKDGGGAQGIITNVKESTINLKVSLKLKTLLEKNNINVIMTRTDDSRSIGNIERAEIANKNNADLCIRIHCDSSDNQNAKGATMLVPGKVGYASVISDKSRKYGQTILDSLVSNAKMSSRGIQISTDMTGFNWSKVPVVLVELGFLSNPNEDKLLNSEEYQEKLAQGLYDGIVSSINIK